MSLSAVPHQKPGSLHQSISLPTVTLPFLPYGERSPPHLLPEPTAFPGSQVITACNHFRATNGRTPSCTPTKAGVLTSQTVLYGVEPRLHLQWHAVMKNSTPAQLPPVILLAVGSTNIIRISAL